MLSEAAGNHRCGAAYAATQQRGGTMAQIGGNIEQLEALTRQFNTQAGQVDALISAINNQMG